MSFALDPEVAEALAPMAEAATSLPEGGDVEGRRAFWEPVIGAAGSAQPMPDDVTTTDHHTTTSDGEQLTLRWYVKDGAAPGPAVVFFHGGGYIFGHIDLFDGPVARYVSASGVSMLSVEYRRAPERPGSHPPTSRSASSMSSVTRTPPTRPSSAVPASPSSSTCIPGSRTSSTPSPSARMSPDAPSPIACEC